MTGYDFICSSPEYSKLWFIFQLKTKLQTLTTLNLKSHTKLKPL